MSRSTIALCALRCAFTSLQDRSHLLSVFCPGRLLHARFHLHVDQHIVDEGVEPAPARKEKLTQTS